MHRFRHIFDIQPIAGRPFPIDVNPYFWNINLLFQLQIGYPFDSLQYLLNRASLQKMLGDQIIVVFHKLIFVPMGSNVVV